MFGVNSVVSPHCAESEAMSRLYAAKTYIWAFPQLNYVYKTVNGMILQRDNILVPLSFRGWYDQICNDAREGQAH